MSRKPEHAFEAQASNHAANLLYHARQIGDDLDAGDEIVVDMLAAARWIEWASSEMVRLKATREAAAA